MKPEKVFKRYDIRGRYPEELDEEFFERMGKSLGKMALNRGEKEAVVCRDNKETSIELKERLEEGINSTGIDILDVGVGTTDYAAFHGHKNDCISVQVTSSHMPLDFNGLKFMYPEGNGFLNQDLNQLEEFFRKEDFPGGEGKRKKAEDPEEEYIRECAEFLEKRGEEFDRKIVIDTLGGSTSELMPKVFDRVGFTVLEVEREDKEDPPNPRPEKLDRIESKVEEEGAYAGIASDLDGDRLRVFFDGRWLTGDEILCVLAQKIAGNVIASIDTSGRLESFADQVYYTRVGDPFVVSEMIERDANLSGEPNGHYCLSEFVNYNSGIAAGGLICSLDLDRMLEKVPESFQEKANIEFPDERKREEAMQQLREKKSDLDVLSEIDGLKFAYNNASVLVRPSGSSPKIRIKSEAEEKENAVEGLRMAEAIIRKE